MAADKPTVWTLSKAIPTINAKASKPTDTALTVTAESIVKNGKPTDGKVIHLTVAHLRQPEFTFTYDPATGKATISRNEGKRGRGSRKPTEAETLNSFLSNIRK